MRAKVGKTAPKPPPPAPAGPMPPPPPPPAPSHPPHAPKEKVTVSVPAMMAPPPPRPSAAPPRPPPTPPATSGVLPGFEGMGSDDDEEGEEEAGVAPPPTSTAAAGLPAGFFDEGMEEDDAAAAAAGEDQEEEEEEEEQQLAMPVPPPAPTEEDEASGPASGSSALPMGFFDDAEADAAAHGIDLKAKKEEELKTEWNEFQKFAAAVVVEEADQEAAEEEERDEAEQRGELEHMYYAARLAGLMAQSGEATDRKKKRPGQEVEALAALPIPSKDEAPTLVAAPEEEAGDGNGSAATEISAMLRAKKKRKKTAMDEAFDKDYVPLDPLDWRAKTFG